MAIATKTELVEYVKSGKWPGVAVSINSRKAPEIFMRASHDFKEAGKDSLAQAYEGLSRVVQSVVNDSPFETQPLPELPPFSRQGWIEQLVQAWPTNWVSVLTSATEQDYVRSAAMLLYKQHS